MQIVVAKSSKELFCADCLNSEMDYKSYLLEDEGCNGDLLIIF